MPTETRKPPQRAAANQETCMKKNETDEPIPDTLRSVTAADAARGILGELAQELAYEDVRVLMRIAKRLRLGPARYGPLRIRLGACASRSHAAREELEDAVALLACALRGLPSRTARGRACPQNPDGLVGPEPCVVIHVYR
jgi:hypothetical protein